MKINNYHFLITIPRIGLIAFVFLNLFAMFLYSGGILNDPTTPSYLFLYNFLSDLGRLYSHSGNINFHSSLFFNLSLIIAGIVFIIFYFLLLNIFNNNKKINLLSKAGSGFGILGGFCLIGVALTPSDLYLDLHKIFANWLFRLLFICSIIYSLVLRYDNKFSTRYSIGYIIFSLSIGLYVLVSELGPNPNFSHSALLFQVVSQKIILFIFIGTVYTQTVGIENIKIKP